MVYIRTIDITEKEILEDVITIHLAAFKGFFLTFLGRGFLRQLYRSYCDHESSGVLAAYFEDRGLIGFLAYSGNLSGLYKFMLKKRFVPFAWYSFLAFLRNPKIFTRMLSAFLKPRESKRKEAYVELASIAVHPDVKSNGIGSKLIERLKEIVDFTQYSYIALETDAENNEAANHFYKKNGFVLERVYVTGEGRKMNEYRYRSS